MRAQPSRTRPFVANLAVVAGLLAAAGCGTDAPSGNSYPVEGQEYLSYFLRQIEVTERHDDGIDLPERIVFEDLDVYSGDFGDVAHLLYVKENLEHIREDLDRDWDDLTIYLVDDPSAIFAALGVEYETESGPHELALHFSPILLIVDRDGELFRLYVPAVTASHRPAEPVMAALEHSGQTPVAEGRGYGP